MRCPLVVAASMVVLTLIWAGCRSQSAPQTAAPAPSPEVNEVSDATSPSSTSRFVITSSAFKDHERIPARFTADGADLSPPLAWRDAPEGTVSFLLIMDDPDAPRGTWTHWILHNLPAQHNHLPEGVPPKETLAHLGGARQDTNDFGRIGYGGPAPPRGPVHHYRFTIYALKRMLELPRGARRAQVDAALKADVILGQARLVGTYSR